jgi:hypothetical protein
MNELKDTLRQGLLESFKPRISEDSACALCGKTNAPLAFHMLESSYNEGDNLPKSFVPMSASRGRVRGSFPICTSCAPACKKCQLPIPTEKVLELGHMLHAKTGNGICQHVQMKLLFSVMLKRLFKIGRFSS